MDEVLIINGIRYVKDTEDKGLRPTAYAKKEGVSVSTIWRWIKEGLLETGEDLNGVTLVYGRKE